MNGQRKLRGPLAAALIAAAIAGPAFGQSQGLSPTGPGTAAAARVSTATATVTDIDLNTRQRQRLSAGDALQSAFSPHQKRIAYWSRPDRYGQREHIWTIPANGGQAVAVTDGSSTDLNPVWSPDGKYLYFSSNRGGSSNIWRVAIDEETGVTSGVPEAVTAMGGTTAVLHLSVSRDGRLAYSAQTELRNLRGVSFNAGQGTVGKPVSITQGSMQLWFPDPSPDGQWLTAYSMGQQRHIFVMRTDGSEQRDVTPGEYRYAWPRWSPDGQRIVFSSRRTGEYELWIVNRDGSDLRQLTQCSGGHYSPWSADGTMIAYSIHTPRNDCVVMNPDKSWGEQKLVYLAPLSDASLSFEAWSWSPDGKKLAGIKHLSNGVHSGIGVYDLETKTYDWLTDFGDWPIWLNDKRRLLFVSQGKLLLFDTQTRKYQQLLVVNDQDVDRYILSRYAAMAETVVRAYEQYDYPVIFQTINQFLTVDLSAFYADVSKDGLYTLAAGSPERRSAQTAMYVMADGLARLLAPILPVTADELWRHLPPSAEASGGKPGVREASVRPVRPADIQ